MIAAASRCLVLLPCGPGIEPAFVQDTLDSICANVASASTDILILDDTADRRFASLPAATHTTFYIPSADVYNYADAKPSTSGPLWLKQMKALARIIRPEHDVILRLDTDAVVTGSSPESIAREVFAAQPNVGVLGAFTIRGDGSDKTTAMAVVGDQIGLQASVLRNRWAILRKPALFQRARELRRLLKAAAKNGYRPGDTCTGGAVFFRGEMVRRWLDLGFANLDHLRLVTVADDTLFGLAAYAAGYALADAPSGLMAVNWQGMPMEPGEIVRRGIKLVHPVKSVDDAEQRRIRAIFSRERAVSAQNLH